MVWRSIKILAFGYPSDDSKAPVFDLLELAALTKGDELGPEFLLCARLVGMDY